MMKNPNVDLNTYMPIPRSKKTFWLGFCYAGALYIFYMVVVGILANILNTSLPLLAFLGTLLLVIFLGMQYWLWRTTKYYVGKDYVIVINRLGMKRSPLEGNDEFIVRTNLVGRVFNSGDFIVNNPFAGVKFRLNDIHDPYKTLEEVSDRFGVYKKDSNSLGDSELPNKKQEA